MILKLKKVEKEEFERIKQLIEDNGGVVQNEIKGSTHLISYDEEVRINVLIERINIL
jgi:hypothetical protein